MNAPLHTALVIACFGRHSLAQTPDGTMWQVFAKGKKREVAVGDSITLQPSGDHQAWIESITPRRNLLYRSDAVRSKLFAANVDQTLLMLANSPPYSSELLGRTWVACKTAGIDLHVIFNKTDLLESASQQGQIERDLSDWTHHEAPLHFLSIKAQPIEAKTHLETLLANKTTLILGQSGMGKSSLLNVLIPEAVAAVNDISVALNSGKHTTTHTRMYFGQQGMRLIDSPGFQAFGLGHLDDNTLHKAFEEIHERAWHCRFANCQHKQEPHCAVKEAIAQGELFAPRLGLMHQLQRENHIPHQQS